MSGKSANPAAPVLGDDFQDAPPLAVLFQHKQFQGFNAAARVRRQERLAERRQPCQGTGPQHRSLEKFSTIWLVASYLMIHHFSFVFVF